MSLVKPKLRGLALRRSLTLYERFERIVVFGLTVLIALIVIAAWWNLLKPVVTSLLLLDILDPTDPALFRPVLGAVFTVVLALEFKRSLLVVVERRFGIVRVRAVVMIGMLAVVRKFIILDPGQTEPMTLLALGGAMPALGTVHWPVRDQDRREAEAIEAQQP